MVRGRDACWEHCVLVDATKQKVRCNYCQREFSGGVYRMKFHLAQIKNKDVVPCTEVPMDVRDRIKLILSTPKKQKTPKRQKEEDQALNCQQHSSSGSGGVHPNHGSSEENGSTSPSMLVRHHLPSENMPVDEVQHQKRYHADRKIAAFFFQNSIPFSAAKSTYYQDMVDAVGECGVGYKAPSSERLRSSLLESVKADIHEQYNKVRNEWKETGCTVLCNSWSDDRNKTILAFSVTCPKGTFFLRSVDIPNCAEDPTYLFTVIEGVILEVGVENIVQVITESTKCFVYVGRLLMEKYSSLFWSPCASHCINKMLEDFSQLDWVHRVLEEANTITRYIYGNDWILAMMRKFTCGGELIRPKVPGFVSHFLSLRSIVTQEVNLKRMFSHPEWLSSIHNRGSEVQAIVSLLYLDRFWNSAREAVSVTEPLIKILRIVDGDMPAIGYIYEGMVRAKLNIKAYYRNSEEKYEKILELIDNRWYAQLLSPLLTASAFLNPSIFYNPSFKMDSRMRNGFQEAMMKMAREDQDKVDITVEHPVYINAQGSLGTEFSIKGRTLNSPDDWWAAYGYEIPTLQRAAIQILSQPCSSHWCRWNWITFRNMHDRRCLRGEPDKLNDLVYVHCNLWLQAIDRSRDGRNRPINFEGIDLSAEWPTESEASLPLTDDALFSSLPPL
ncbi:OLC1v1029383C1 [Oldenlandia corymbosa var. corymbosa]|uniref:OLC1v1029383C1 n=1 Tax=Oldenlandia corymbosa var. corymbosa TaxID=529605 RepID=A0AAV1CFJ4_OLDCO|nr:OLC1v1029383C1 [Oldenlandia corymbosa var. corymbosa]